MAIAHCGGKDTLVVEAPGNTDHHELFQRSPFWHQDPAPPNCLQAPELEHLRPNNQQDRNRAPPINRQAAQSCTELTVTSKHTPWRGPAHKRDKPQLHPPEGRHQSLPPGSMHKPLDQPHPPGGRHQKRNYDPAACRKETTNTQS